MTYEVGKIYPELVNKELDKLDESDQLESPLELPVSDTGKTNTTVQLLGEAPDRHAVVKFLQVHNRLETLVLGAPIIPMYGRRAKPPGLGNPGGGMEPNELELFKKNEPEWYKYYDSLGTLTPEDLKIIGCAMRESKDESGFCDLEIVLDEDTKKLIILTDYHYREGHRVLTVWGKYSSYQSRPIKESDEIDYADWVDFSLPMIEVYERLRRKLPGWPVYPYWSHLRRILSSIRVIERYHRNLEGRANQIGRLIHPAYRTVFPVGKGDSRFPANGYLISPYDWYHMFDIMLEKGIEGLSNDVLLSEFNGRSKTKILVYDFEGKPHVEARKEDLNLKGKIELAKEQRETVSIDMAGSEDYTGIPSSAEMIAKEDQEYAKWLETELGLGH